MHGLSYYPWVVVKTIHQVIISTMTIGQAKDFDKRLIVDLHKFFIAQIKQYELTRGHTPSARELIKKVFNK